MEYWNIAILVGALLLFVSIVASDISSRMGVPLLLVFLVLGMLAGEDGPGGIRYDEFEASYLVGTLALAVIIFDGGMRTRQETFRVALAPAVVLATAGVVGTAGLLGAFAAWALGIGWLEGMLLGSIVGSTDAAAVFALLRNAGATLKARVASTLEIESASNDPMAIFLTIAVLEVLIAGGTSLEASVLVSLLRQFSIGAVLGLAGGRLLVRLINRLTLITGLYPLLAAAGGLVIFAATAQLSGSGFLAIYLAGLVLGNSRMRSAQNIMRVHDGLAWLSQIVMFVLLGLLLTPSQLLDVAAPALAISAFLMLVARPLAVSLCLLPFRYPWREHLYIGWVGLRGAVPVVLAMFPIIYGVDNARLYFNVAFFIVLVSLLAQGGTIAAAARFLRLEVPPPTEPLQRVTLDVPGHFEHEILCYEVKAGSLVAGRGVAAARLPHGVQVMAVMRDGLPQQTGPGFAFAPGDYVFALAHPEELAHLGKLFDPHVEPERLEPHRYFGDFILNGDAVLGELAAVYGLEITEEAAGKTLARYLAELFHGRAVVGDRVRLGAAELVVREIEKGRVTRVGLLLR
ncbi:MAG: potassium/proton antiporter [Burkholderiales bacterium]|nr:potassium/proton antiporter [Burkholderiales bacterium]